MVKLGRIFFLARDRLMRGFISKSCLYVIFFGANFSYVKVVYVPSSVCFSNYLSVLWSLISCGIPWLLRKLSFLAL